MKNRMEKLKKSVRTALIGLASLGLVSGCTYSAGEGTYDSNSLQGRITTDILNNGDVINTTDYDGYDGTYSSRNFSFIPGGKKPPDTQYPSWVNSIFV